MFVSAQFVTSFLLILDELILRIHDSIFVLLIVLGGGG